MMDRTLIPVLFGREWFVVLLCAALFVVLASAHSYRQNPDAQKVTEALKRVQEWQLHRTDLAEHLADVRLVSQADAVEAIPSLKEEFAETKDAWAKLAVASALVKLGAKEQAYWDFLSNKAKEAVDNDAPSVFLYDSEGKVDRKQREYAPEFIAWAKAHNQDPAAAAQAQTFDLPRDFLYLAEIGDPRGRELLRRGLKSRNRMIQSYAALGLAKLHDKDSIPLIIEAGNTMPKDGTVFFVVQALLFFDDPGAQSAADMFMSDKQALQLLRSKIRARGGDPFSN